jgi:predicted unusual protein kinase regulating ubiquinone biosynthesis (AarF/ABC1/UbiB family)
VRSLAWSAVRAACRVAADLAARPGTRPARAASAELRSAFQELGPTFVKLGQLISASPGTFPELLVDEMARCQDAVPPEPWEQVAATLAEELPGARGEPGGAVFEWVDWRPLAAASIAEVYPARLRDGSDVVLKVQRRHLLETLREDLRALMAGARVASRLVPSLAAANPVGVVEDFARGLAEELDFTVEASHMEQLAAALEGWGVRVPRVRRDLTTPKVLTMERLSGTKISDVDELRRRGLDLPALADTILGSLLTSALGHGIFHGDAHAGNVLVQDDGTLALIDFGIVGKLDERTRRSMAGLLVALVGRRFREVALAIIDLAGATGVDVDSAVADLESIAAAYLDRPWAEVPLARMLQELLRSANHHGIVLPADLVLLFKQILYLDGLGHLLNPGFELFQDGARFVQFMSPDPPRLSER